MLRILFFTVATVVMFPAQAANKVPKDFWLRLEFGCAGLDIVDTGAGTYVRQESGRNQIADVFVPSKLKQELFDLVSAARFFEMKSSGTGLGLCEPTTYFQLQVRSNGQSHIVRWGECYISAKDAGEEGLRLRTLAEGILKPFQAMGRVKMLRPRDSYCL